MSLLSFCQWLDSTRGSTAIHESLYGYPLIESTHVWALTLFVGFAAVLDLRLLGIGFRHIPVSELTRRLLPWTIAGFVIMVISGVLLFYAIPVRTYQSIFFRAKLIFLILAGINVWLYHTGIARRIAEWDLAARVPRRAKIAGLTSLVLWTLIIFAGRMIAYNWFDCDRQPQPRIINWLTECKPEPQG
jgi:hypothetical protein